MPRAIAIRWGGHDYGAHQERPSRCAVSGNTPSASIENGRLTIRFVASDSARRVDVEGVLDQTGLGEVVGVEILDLRSQLGGAEVPPTPGGGLPRWSYDAEIDAFYVRVADERAPIQKRVSGMAVLNGSGLLVSLEVPVSP
jgi:hypothetical protein